MRNSSRQRDVTIPHFKLPFRFGGIRGGALMNEQSSIEDIEDCIKAIIAFPIDSLDSQPDFGVPDFVFEEYSGQIPYEVQSAIMEWEDRAVTEVDGSLNVSDPFVWDVIMKVGRKSA